MKLGGRKIHVKKIAHKSSHVVHMASKKGSHVAKVGGKALVITGKLTGQPEIVAAGKASQEVGRELGRVSKVSGKAERMTR
jgi:uncharacterized protein YjbJ (UPF0337 family)|tara:strand:+ start:143 stop:385 length:243 start_codon:yes stop_codon:yes gene_type:complete